jgi:thioester reductase-like protein
VTVDTAIAVVGVGCRFPDADTPEQFWANLDSGLVCVRELPEQLLRQAGVSPEVLNRTDYVRMAATLADPELFAAEFFGYPPSEAELIDPQQRLFLEVCWEALERAGHPPEGGPQVGVFAGSSFSTYTTLLQFARVRTDGLALGDLALQLGSGADFMAPRVAHKLGLRGPSVAVQTACSSSLTAVHYAVLSLLSGECDIALAGGTAVASPATGYQFQPGGILSQDGYCRAFDARSSGTSVGSGVGVVVLRRLADALADRDPVLAVISGSAVGNDGAQRPGFTAPTPAGPADVVAAALHAAGVGADALCYVEAHGSGTQLGDHVELRGLTEGLRLSSARTAYCALGSVKVNVGHTGAAAGIAGLIKGVHVASTGSLPPHPLFERPRDPGLLAESPFYVPTTAGRSTDNNRHVLVNSMGLGGTNAAVVLTAPPAIAGPPDPGPAIQPAPGSKIIRLQLSARTRSELDAASRRLADELDRQRLPLGDIAYTLRVGRHDFAERRVVAGRPEQLAAALRLPRPGLASTRRATERRAVVALAAAPKLVEPLRQALLDAFGLDTEVLDTVPDSVPAGCFLVVVGDGAQGPDRHVLPVAGEAARTPLADRLDEALSVAWLHGVRVNWSARDGAARRVILPTYPFQRRRFWALDAVTDLAPAGSTATPTPAALSDSIEGELIALWQELFGIDSIGVNDEFGALGGTSLLSVRMALEVQQRYGVLVNLHRLGGSQVTIRRLGEVLRTGAGPSAAGAELTQAADGDGGLVDADLTVDLGPVAPVDAASGSDVLLTGASGFVGSFVLHELIQGTEGRIYCPVRAADEAQGWQRLRAAAAQFQLPAPDPDRVVVVPGDLRDVADICAEYRGGELARRVGHVLHCAARVVFTEPYRVLRADNVLPMLDLLNWMRKNGIADLSYVSSLAACGHTLGMGDQLAEHRQQPLDPQTGGYGVSKWVGERLLDRAEQDGMRVRVFRPCFISGSTQTGACNPKDLLWRLMAASIAVGAHPLDDRPVPVAPVDLIAQAIVALATSPGSVGRAYHLVAPDVQTMPRLFATLGEAGFPTRGMPTAQWHGLVAEHAVRTGDAVLSSVALYDVENIETSWNKVECRQWQGWLGRHGLLPGLDADRLLRMVRYLTEQPEFRDLLLGTQTATSRR